MVFKIVVLALMSVPVLIWAASPLYFLFGVGKWLYHDALGWHQPRKDVKDGFDGCSVHNICKHCGKEIMQDSQGNWF